jgi:hypothetical protein
MTLGLVYQVPRNIRDAEQELFTFITSAISGTLSPTLPIKRFVQTYRRDPQSVFSAKFAAALRIVKDMAINFHPNIDLWSQAQ